MSEVGRLIVCWVIGYAAMETNQRAYLFNNPPLRFRSKFSFFLSKENLSCGFVGAILQNVFFEAKQQRSIVVNRANYYRLNLVY